MSMEIENLSPVSAPEFRVKKGSSNATIIGEDVDVGGTLTVAKGTTLDSTLVVKKDAIIEGKLISTNKIFVENKTSFKDENIGKGSIASYQIFTPRLYIADTNGNVYFRFLEEEGHAPGHLLNAALTGYTNEKGQTIGGGSGENQYETLFGSTGIINNISTRLAKSEERLTELGFSGGNVIKAKFKQNWNFTWEDIEEETEIGYIAKLGKIVYGYIKNYNALDGVNKDRIADIVIDSISINNILPGPKLGTGEKIEIIWGGLNSQQKIFLYSNAEGNLVISPKDENRYIYSADTGLQCWSYFCYSIDGEHEPKNI